MIFVIFSFFGELRPTAVINYSMVIGSTSMASSMP